MRKLSSLLIVSLACVLLTACEVDSVHPLGSPDSAKVDSRLLGNWVAKNSDIVHFSAKDAHWMMVETTPSPSDSRQESKKREPDFFFVTTIGTDNFLSMRSVDKDKKVTYSLFRYEVAPDQTLHMWKMSQDEMASAVRAGQLKGIVKDNGTVGHPPRPDVDVHLTDNSERLVRYISRHDPTDIFDDELDTLTKIATKGD